MQKLESQWQESILTELYLRSVSILSSQDKLLTAISAQRFTFSDLCNSLIPVIYVFFIWKIDHINSILGSYTLLQNSLKLLVGCDKHYIYHIYIEKENS